MKNRAQQMVIFILSLLFILCHSISYSQEWSSEEKEAFKIIQNVCDSWAKRDLETYMSFYHSNFIGWFQKDPLPIDKNSLKNWEKYWLSSDIIHHYELKPVSIKITDNIAVINSYLNYIREDEKGKKLTYSKWTDILKKEKGKWLILTTAGGTILEE